MKRKIESVILLICSCIQFSFADNDPITVPEIFEPPSYQESQSQDSEQNPNPVTAWSWATVTWYMEEIPGRYRPEYIQGEQAPPEEEININNFKTKVSDNYRKGQDQTVSYFGGPTKYWYNDPRDGSLQQVDTPPPNLTHSLDVEPKDGNGGGDGPGGGGGDDPFPPGGGGGDDGGGGDPGGGDPGGGDDGGGDDGGGDDDDSDDGRPDQGDIYLEYEVIDESSYITDPDRGSIPTRGTAVKLISKTDLQDDEALGENDLDLAISYSIVTINSPDARDLYGTLSIEVIDGDKDQYEFYMEDHDTGIPAEIGLPYSAEVDEPGHVGDGIHDWHRGYRYMIIRFVGSQQQSVENSKLELKFTVNPAEGAPMKTSNLILIPTEFEVFPKDQSQEIGGDRSPNWKPHALNMDTKQNEGDHYGDFDKCVAHIWSAGTLNLAKFLEGYNDNKDYFEDPEVVKWTIDHVGSGQGPQLQDSFELNLGAAPPEENKVTSYRIEATPTDGRPSVDHMIVTVIREATLRSYENWKTTNASDLSWLNDLPAVYISLDQGNSDPEPQDPLIIGPIPPVLECDHWADLQTNYDSFYHPDAYFEIRGRKIGSSIPFTSGKGHQACYDDNGNLILPVPDDNISPGSADREVPVTLGGTTHGHVNADVLPFIWAAQLDGNPVQGTDGIGPGGIIPIENTNLTTPILSEGVELLKYAEYRPAIANTKPLLQPGNCP